MPAAPSQLPTPGDHKDRRHERTHLFLAASLQSNAGTWPVHVRNISASGALIEGSIIPDQGDNLVLRRGSLEAPASLVWKAGRQAGLAFASAIGVAEWMARLAPTHQGRVDEMILAVRAAGGNRGGSPNGRNEQGPARSIEADIIALRGTLADLEKGLLADIILIATHPEIQLLDIALQSVDRMLAAVRKT